MKFNGLSPTTIKIKTTAYNEQTRLKHKCRPHTRNSKRIHHLKILNKTEREENSGNETKEE
jgi:hypothetical protein